jgi:outer membrane receptor protein involved in Fe transport
VGNYDTRSVQGAINLPISEQWNARIDAKHRKSDGYFSDVNSGADINSIDRSMVRAQLTREDDVSSLRLIADWATSDSVCCAGIVTDRSPLSANVTAVAAATGNLGYGSANPTDYEVGLSVMPSDEVSDWGFSAEYNRDIDGMNLTSVTAYRDWESDVLRDGDMSGADLAVADSFTSNTSFSQELRLQGESGSVNWLVGAYYLHDEVDLTETFATGSQVESYIDRLLAGLSGTRAPITFQGFGTLPTPAQAGANGIPSIKALAGAANAMDYLDPMPDTVTGMELTTDAIALFTHNEISLSEDLTATIGLRYTSEDKELSYANTSTGSAEACGFANALTGINPQLALFGGLVCLPVANPLFDGTGNDDRSDENISGTAKLAYAVNDDVLWYASFSRGFKSGGYNLSRGGFSIAGGASATDLEFNAEESTPTSWGGIVVLEKP